MTTHVGSRVGPVTRRGGLLALRPARLLALTNKVRLLSSLRRVGHPIPASTMTTRASSQFPRPDSHRQDTPPYGLREEGRKAGTRSRGNDLLSFERCLGPARRGGAVGSPLRLIR